VIYWN